MAKNIIEDVRPPRSIRDIPLPDGRKPRSAERRAEQKSQKPQQKPQRIEEQAEVQEEEPVREMREERTMRYEQERPQRAERSERAERINSEEPIKNNDIEPRDVDRAYFMESDEKKGKGGDFFGSSLSRYILWGIAAICIIALFFAMSIFFTSATVTVTPKTETAGINTSILLSYQTLTFSSTASTSVPAHGQIQVSQKATGQIVVYNNYSTSPQTLIATTRFETSSGLIFRTPTAVTIPGKKGSVPGSLTITVDADQPGANYNIGLTDFTVPGLQSDSARYNGIYARSKTVMSGGESGTEPEILAGDKIAAEDILVSELHSRLLSLAQAETPIQYLFLPNAATTTFQQVQNITNSSTTSSISGSTAVLTEQATITALVFSQSDLASSLAKASLSDYDGEPIVIQNPSQLSISLANPALLNKASMLSQATTTASTTVVVNGTATFVWQYSSNDLKNALKGKSNSDIPSILANFPAISKADVIIKPFWISTLPNNTNKIKLVTASGYTAQ